ncbi:flagellar basal body P-ring formation chaperone FlgA [Acetonema longum]|uniref:Flagella basal body P-ring formation protein FlgA n=1 Tax=Acetonema longum DSM 6540 TaxID=1009370 RepID=F7NIV1_9FIRM|nr:flagellar basal body P-ring formation chaperone FlgA [Acetonema longum]EGO64074.1 flagella basal body P-ring formation protein FlgA [Acetonema longum DSM 6540]
MIKRWLLLVAFMALIVPKTVWANSATAITVAAESIVKGPDITLGEIAAIKGPDNQRIKYLSRIKLGPAPAPGQRTLFTRELLGIRLQAAQADYDGIVWQVPPEFQVTTASQLLAGDRLQKAALAGLKKKLVIDASEDVEVTLLDPVGDRLAPTGTFSFDVQIPASIRYSTPMSFYLLVQHEGTLYQRIPLKCTVRRFAPIVVTVRPIKAHEVLTAEKLQLERRDVGRLTADYITDMEKVIGLEVKRTLMTGTVLTASLLNQPVQVKRNSPVTIVGRVAGIEITAAGVALQDGRNGQVIQVRNQSSQRVVAAKVISAGMVQVLTYQTN